MLEELPEDKIFAPYYTDLLIEKFEEHTGYKVSLKQEMKLILFLHNWTKENLASVMEA